MSQDSRSVIAIKIQALRKCAGITREELSLALGFDNSYISKLEHKKVNITIDKLDKIASYFNIETYKLLK